MLEKIKTMAMQMLAEKMEPNRLGTNETQAAASEGASELISSLIKEVSNGQLLQITSLFSNDGASTESNPLFQGLQSTLQGILQSKGMSAQEAIDEAQSTAPDLINSLKEKFMSTDDADKDFDLSNIAGLLGGNAVEVLGKRKNLF